MIGAICYKVTSEYQAKIYMVGTYNQIDWTNEHSCTLGEDFVFFAPKGEQFCKNGINIAKGIDGQPILRLVEAKRYIVKIECLENKKAEIPRFQNEGNKFLKLEKDCDSVIFQFINYLGRTKILFAESSKEIRLEIIPEKMDYEDDYIKLTEALAQKCSELLLEHSGSTSNVYTLSDESGKTLLEQFIFLRQFCYSQNIFGLFESIKRNPDRKLCQEEEFEIIGRGIPSKKFYTNPFANSRGWQKSVSVHGSMAYMPQEVTMTRKYDSIDTPANRFIRFALQKFDEICKELISALNEENASTSQTECFLEAKEIHEMIKEIFNDSFWNNIGRLDIMPQNNQVLQKREGYSQIFAAYSMVDLALRLDWKGKAAVYEGESKNVALLYEYWLFFELYKIISSIEGCEKIALNDSDFISYTNDGMVISLEEGKKSRQSFVIERLRTKINLYYNRTFSAADFKTTLYEGSYSRPFRPDYTLAIFPDVYKKGVNNGENEAAKDGAVSYIHFDAKYRITDITSLIGKNTTVLDDNEIIEDKIDAVLNTYKRGDLLKMHTYNDAIRRTIGSFILYPGSDDSAGKKKTEFRLYDEILPGVGAFAIRPSIDKDGEGELKAFIDSLLHTKGIAHSRLNRMKHYMEMVLREPSITEISTVKGNSDIVSGDKQRGKQYVVGYIKADKDDDYYHSLVRNKLLDVGSEFLFYFYAIKEGNVYSHHQDVFRLKDFRFYKNSIHSDGVYRLEPVLCSIESNELISKKDLTERLINLGIDTSIEKHKADFYYVMRVKVIDNQCSMDELEIQRVNAMNGNDTFSPHSPKVIDLKLL